MNETPQISIVIPAYNEANRILRTLQTLREYLNQSSLVTEVIVVNDSSTDQTATIVEEFSAQWQSLRLIHNPQNRGKGYGVRNGALHSNGDIILFTDADLSAPITEMPKLIDPILERNFDITFGSRAIDRSLIGIHQSRFRETSGRIFNFFVQLLIGLPFKDTQCGFKAFRRQTSLPVFERQTIMGFGFDPELLYVAQRRGLRLLEVPVKWNHVEGTTVRFLTDSVKMIIDLFRIRWNDLTGKYR